MEPELEFKKRVAKLEEEFKAMDEAFQKWKEGVLQFEHFRVDSGDDFDGDNLFLDGELVRTGEDEDDIQSDADEDDGEPEVGCAEEGGEQ